MSTFQEKAGYSLKRRSRTLLRRLFGSQMLKSQDLRFVDINGHRFKRLILHDSYLAAEIERNLEAFGPCEALPRLITCHENEIWVEFIDGRRLERADAAVVEKAAAFFAQVHARRPRRTALADTVYPARLQRNLRFLGQIGILEERIARQLEALAGRLAPDAVWIGYDYVDPVLKNFVIAADDGRFCAIDVESLVDGQLIGTGVAKACVHWLEPHRQAFLDALGRHYDLGETGEAPDFRPYFDYIELMFLARWTKTKFLTGKQNFVDPKRFDRFLSL